MKLSHICSTAMLGLLLFAPSAALAEEPPSPAPSAAPTVEASPVADPTPRDAQQALFQLLTGNTRFYQNRSVHANQGAFARSKSSVREYPWCIVVTCSDSRVPPEIIFDQGLGDMTVVRSWGSYVGDTAVGSIQHALEDHGPNLIVVLSHKRCGAIQSAVEGKHETGAAAKLVAAVSPAVGIARKYKGDLVDNASKENARLVCQRLMTYPFVAQRVKAGKLRVVPAYYDIDTGKVKLLNLNKQP